MGKQTFDKIKKTLAILLVVLFVASLTVSSVSAVSSSFQVQKIGTTYNNDGYCVSYRVSAGSYLGNCPSGSCSYLWDFGDGDTRITDLKRQYHTYTNCNAHTIALTVTDSTDNTQSTSRMTVSP